jgi:hypothetical protein
MKDHLNRLATLWPEGGRWCRSAVFEVDEALAFEANMEGVINHAFQTAIKISQDVDSVDRRPLEKARSGSDTYGS